MLQEGGTLIPGDESSPESRVILIENKITIYIQKIFHSIVF